MLVLKQNYYFHMFEHKKSTHALYKCNSFLLNQIEVIAANILIK